MTAPDVTEWEKWHAILNFDTTIHLEKDEVRVAFELPVTVNISVPLISLMQRHFSAFNIHTYPLASDAEKELYVIRMPLSERQRSTTFGVEIFELLRTEMNKAEASGT